MSVLRTVYRLAALGVLAAASAIPHAYANDCGKNHYILPPCQPSTPAAPSVVATEAAIGPPGAVAVDDAGTVYFSSPNIVFKVDRGGNLTRVAGNGAPGFAGDGGPALDALLSFPRSYPELESDPWDFNELLGALAVDRAGNLYIADAYNNRVRKVGADGVISTVMGNGDRCFDNCIKSGHARSVSVAWPTGVAAGDDGAIFVVSAYGWLSRVNPEGVVSTITLRGCADNPGQGLCDPKGIALESAEHILVADGYCRVRKVGLDGTMFTIAGIDPQPEGLGNLIACGLGVPVADVAMRPPFAVATDKRGNVFIADTKNHCIQRVDATGVMTTFAGVCGYYTESTVRGNPFRHFLRGGFSGDLGLATMAELRSPHGVAVDAEGNVYIADTGNLRIRKVSPDGIITTVAGNGEDFATVPGAGPL